MKFIMLINVKMPTLVGILTFISMINTSYESLKAINTYLFQHLSLYELVKFYAQLSWAWKKLYNLKAWSSSWWARTKVFFQFRLKENINLKQGMFSGALFVRYATANVESCIRCYSTNRYKPFVSISVEFTFPGANVIQCKFFLSFYSFAVRSTQYTNYILVTTWKSEFATWQNWNQASRL